MKALNQHQALIAQGATHHSTAAVLRYREHWERQGFDLPSFDPEQRPDPPQKKRGGCGCQWREAKLNNWLPGLGTLVRWITTITGIKWLVDRLN